MKFYKHWAPGEATVDAGKRSWKLRAYGGSDQSLEDAKRRAREVAERAATAIAAGPPRRDYAYSDRPIREEIVEELTDGGERIGVITRNSYGALVLNTAVAMFVDVDFGPDSSQRAGKPAALGGALKQLWVRLTGQPAAASDPPPIQEFDAHLERFHQVARNHSGLGVRVYRTAGGYRLLATSGPFDPGSSETSQLLVEFGGDPLYRRLGQSQECFRARLTAKFWRCGASRPPSRYPWDDARAEAKYRQWEQAYHSRANRFAACAFVASFGEPAVLPSIRPIVAAHDRLAILDGAQLA